MSVIAYDHPVKDLIAGLDATGHVSHRSYRKKSVTIHHNAGRLSHEGVLRVWQVRPASAHFNVDAAGTVAQYVRVNEYAWATGNTRGNQESISIEMANSTLSPNWEVAETTWRSAARLAGWLHAKVIGVRPSAKTLLQHKDWKSTACAGPHIAKVWDELMAEAQRSYDYFKGTSQPPPRPANPANARKSNTQIAAEVWAGRWGSGEDRKRRLASAGYDANAIQALVNRGVGKTASGTSTGAPRKSVVQLAAEVIAGQWGNGSDRRTRLARAGYNATAVQAEVNRQLGAPKAASQKSIAQLASEVIAGEWGNGAERRRRLAAAGYSYQAVQAEVNRRF